jgi:hypothetical protein
MQDTVARPVGGGAWWLMSGRERGLSRFSYPHPSLRDLVERWEVTLGALLRDEYGEYLEVKRAASPTSPDRVAAAWRLQDAAAGSAEHEVAEVAVYALELAAGSPS